MSKKVSKRKQAQAKKHAAKAARYAARKDKDTSNSAYAERKRARNRGVPMADRSGERRPWWEFGPGLPLSVEMARFASQVQKRDESREQAA